jgi:superoxide reductase
MTELNAVYRCDTCGNVTEVLHPGDGMLVCCGRPMTLLAEQDMEVGREKHVPMVEIEGNSVIITVGAAPHPMIEEHYIEWIEIMSGDKVYRKYLKPGDLPHAEFHVLAERARAYCNVHGLWTS